MAAHAGNLLLLCALLAASISLLLRARFCQRIRWVWQSALLFSKEGLDALEHEEIKRKFHKSLLAKAKIVIAAWQIGASTATVRSSRRSSLIRSDNRYSYEFAFHQSLLEL